MGEVLEPTPRGIKDIKARAVLEGIVEPESSKRTGKLRKALGDLKAAAVLSPDNLGEVIDGALKASEEVVPDEGPLPGSGKAIVMLPDGDFIMGGGLKKPIRITKK